MGIVDDKKSAWMPWGTAVVDRKPTRHSPVLRQGLQIYLGFVMLKNSYWAMLRSDGYLVRGRVVSDRSAEWEEF